MLLRRRRKDVNVPEQLVGYPEYFADSEFFRFNSRLNAAGSLQEGPRQDLIHVAARGVNPVFRIATNTSLLIRSADLLHLWIDFRVRCSKSIGQALKKSRSEIKRPFRRICTIHQFVSAALTLWKALPNSWSRRL